MIYDCFQFHNELEILDIRLHELENVVDKFVLVESTVTHSCKPKPLYFQENKNRFKKFQHKIIHIVINDTPDVTLPWIVNDYQFSQLARGLKKCRPTDIIIFGDVDEIPKATTIREWKNKPGRLKVFEQFLAYYFLNYMDSHTPWYGTRMTTFQHLSTYKTMWIAKFAKPDTIIPNGGWHFSYMGGIKRIQQKLSSMTHQEFNTDTYNTKEHILQAIAKGKNFMPLHATFSITNTNLLPSYVQQNKKMFDELLIKKDSSNLYKKIKISSLEVKKKIRLIVRQPRIIGGRGKITLLKQFKHIS